MCPHSVGGVKGFSKAPELLSQFFLLLGGSDSVGNGVGSGCWQAAVIQEGQGQEPGQGKLELLLKGVALAQHSMRAEGSWCRTPTEERGVSASKCATSQAAQAQWWVVGRSGPGSGRGAPSPLRLDHRVSSPGEASRSINLAQPCYFQFKVSSPYLGSL